MKSVLSIFLCGLLYVAPSFAQTSGTDADSITLSDRTLAQIQKNPDQFVEHKISQLYKQAPDGVWTVEIFETHKAMQTARFRSHEMEELLRYDLDANLEVSASELETVMAVLNNHGKAELQTTVIMSDADKNGALSMQEILDAAMRKDEARLRPSIDNHPLMEFDLNNDGTVTPQEISAIVTQVMERN